MSSRSLATSTMLIRRSPLASAARSGKDALPAGNGVGAAAAGELGAGERKGGRMASTENMVRKAVADLGAKVMELAWTLGRDEREEARMQRRWRILETALSAVFSVAARQVSARAWNILTGEDPPTRRAARAPAGGRLEGGRVVPRRAHVAEEPVEGAPREAGAGMPAEETQSAASPGASAV